MALIGWSNPSSSPCTSCGVSCCLPGGQGQDPPRQLPGQHPPVLRAGVDVCLGLDVRLHGLGRGLEVGVGRLPAAEHLGQVEHRRHLGHGDERRGRPLDHAVDDGDGRGDPGHGVVAVAPGRLGEGGGRAGREAPEAYGGGQLVGGKGVSRGPEEEVGGRDLAGPPGPGASTTPSVRARIAGISPAASAWAIEPTVVPRLRIAGWATFSSAWRRSGSAAYAPRAARAARAGRGHRCALPRR